MSRTQGEVNNEQERRTLQSMQAGKAALIAYAASRSWRYSSAYDQPGALPCPADDDLGVTALNCTSTATQVGRFPWKTVGASELRDGSGQILWYALSGNFRKSSATVDTVINSDTQGALTVTGSNPANNAVAVIIAPGPALIGQTRCDTCAIGNYLESTNAAGNGEFVTKLPPDTWNNSDDREVVFNDRILVITQADLMAVVEPAVVARIERDIKPFLETYRSEWGRYPYPALFGSPTYTWGPGTSTGATPRTQDNYVGIRYVPSTTTTLTNGLLPLTRSANYDWTSDSDPATLVTGTADNITESCSMPANKSRVCNIKVGAKNSISACGAATPYCIKTPKIHVDGRAGDNVGKSFARLPTTGEENYKVTVALNTGGDATCTANLMSQTISGTLNSNGRGTINYEFTLSYSGYKATDFECRYIVTFPPIATSSITDSSLVNAGWFIKNEWYRQTYYAVSQGYLPSGGGSCTPGSTCLTVNNLAPLSFTPLVPATANDKKAILVFAGRALTGLRPTMILTNYLEDQNQTPDDQIFVHKFKSPSGITPIIASNDQVIVLSP